jgi:hypothetical protein
VAPLITAWVTACTYQRRKKWDAAVKGDGAKVCGMEVEGHDMNHHNMETCANEGSERIDVEASAYG